MNEKKIVVELMKVNFGVLSLQPGDVLVLMYDDRLSAAGEAYLRDAMRHEFPKQRCIVLGSRAKLGVIRAGDAADEAVIIHGNAAAPEPGGVINARGEPIGHEFDSSRTCNYCGIAAERVPGIPERAQCPRRVNRPKCRAGAWPG